MKMASVLLPALICCVGACAMSESGARDIATRAVCQELRDRGKSCSELQQPAAVNQDGKWLFDYMISSEPEHLIGVIVHPDGTVEITEFDASKRNDLE
jgi:hypothetical protein